MRAPRTLLTLASIAALVATVFAGVQIASADNRLVCLPPAVVQTLS